MRPLLGTFVEVCARSVDAHAAIDGAFASIERSQSLWSFQNSRSELSCLNGSPGRQVPLTSDTVRLLRLAKVLMQSSEATFDCTVGGMLVQQGKLPNHDALGDLLPRGCVQDIELGTHWGRLQRPVRLTLDGLAKGYAVDLAIRALKSQGVVAGWVNAGGDLRVFGEMTLPVGRRELDGSFVSLGILRDAALASSQAKASCEADADFPACIVARPGQRPNPGLWTVLARSAWRADALTKVAATAPSWQRDALVRRLGGQLITPMPAEVAA